jgi:hypothetical protein
VNSYVREISFAPHYTAVTDAGDYPNYENKAGHPVAWSWGEFLDNSLRAMMKNSEKKIQKQITITIYEQEKSEFLIQFHDTGAYIYIYIDNVNKLQYINCEFFFLYLYIYIFLFPGEGMDVDRLNDFASMSRAPSLRGVVREMNSEDPIFVNGEIGEFGVGAKQAAFFNGGQLSGNRFHTQVNKFQIDVTFDLLNEN